MWHDDRLVFICMTNMLLISSLVSLMTMSMEGVSIIIYPNAAVSTSELQQDANGILQVMSHAREEYLFQYVISVSEEHHLFVPDVFHSDYRSTCWRAATPAA